MIEALSSSFLLSFFLFLTHKLLVDEEEGRKERERERERERELKLSDWLAGPH